MPTIVQTFHGKVTGLWGTAHMRGADGKMHLLQLGDVVQKGDVILTTQNGIVQLDTDATAPLPASVAKAATNAGAPDEIDRVISALNDPSGQDATAAGVSGGDGAGDLAPGLRVDRISENVTPASLPSSPDDAQAVRPAATGAVPTDNNSAVPAPVLGASSNIIDATEEGAAVNLGLSAPANASSAAVITVTQVPVIGQLQKADGTVIAAGSVITASDLVGLKYVPPADYNGTAPVGEFGYTVTDAGHTASGTVGIVLAAVNDAPVAVADTATGLEDTPITGNVLTNDSDVDGPSLQVTQYTIAGVVHAAGSSTAIVGVGSIVVNADGSYTFTPVADYNGPVPVIGYTISDGSLTSSSTLTLSVTAVNDAPTAAADLASTPINVAVTIPVLANDHDRDGDTLTVTAATLADPAQGSVTINPDGSLSFTPASNYTGTATITYTVSDGHGGTDTATVTVNVGNNTPPTGADSTHTLAEDSAYTVATSDFGFADADAGQTLANVRIDTIPTTGTLLLNGVAVAAGVVVSAADIAAGHLVFVPAANGNGAPYASFSFSVQDSAGGYDTSPNTLTLNVTPVNDAPVAVNDTGSGLEDTPQTGNVLSNDSDVDGDTLSVTQFVVGGTTYAAGATAALAGVGTLSINADGSYHFTPAANYNGPVPVATYTMTDGHLTQDATLSLSITAVNDAPVAVNDLASTPINTAVTIDVLANDTDVDGDTLSVSNPVLANPTQGTVVVNPDGTLGFTPANNVSGPVVITYTVSDGHGGTDTATVTVNVGNNTPPTGADSTHTLLEDGSYTVATSDFGFADADAGQTLANVRIDTLPAAGALLLNGVALVAGAIVSATEIAAGHLVFVPAADGNGAPYASFTFSVQDSAGAFDTAPNTLTLNVTPQPDAAVISGNTTGATVEDTTLVASGKLDVTDPDAGEAAFVVQSGSAGAHGSFSIDAAGHWTYTLNNADPAVQALGAGQTLPSEVFAVQSIDGTTVNVTVSITGTDDAPVISTGTGAVTENTAPSTSGTLTATDVDNPTLAFMPATVNGSYGSLVLQADGHWTYTLDARAEPLAQGQVVSEPLTVTLTDGSTTTVTVTITGTNDAAVITPAVANLTETNAVLTTGGTLAITDVDSPATFVAQTNVAGSNGYGHFTLGTNGAWTYSTDTAHNEFVAGTTYTDTLTVTSADGTTSTITVNILGTNDAAVITPAVANLTETNAVLTTGGTLAITDVDSPATFVAQTNVAGSNGYGHFTLGTNGAWTYSTDTAHNEFAAGTTYTDTLTVTSADGTTSTITVNILGTNDAAVITPAVANLTETNAVLTTGGTLAITDVDSPATFVAQTNVAGSNGYGHFTLGTNGAWTYSTDTAHNEFVAGTTYTDTLTVTSADGTTSTITVNILGTNDAAVITPAVANLTETDAVLTTGGTLAITDVDSPATFVAQTNVAGSNGYGHFTLGTNGTWSYSTDTAHNEFVAGTTYTDTLTVTSADGTTSTITVNILGTNDAPVVTVPVAQSTAEDTSKVITGVSVADVDSASLTTTLTVAHGTLSVVTGSGAAITNNGSGTVTLSGTAAQINAALASITYKPTADFNGADTLNVTTSDGSATTNAAVAIAVSAVPDIVADMVAGTEDVAVTFNPITGANEVSGADNFENAGRALTAVGTPAHGSVTFAADGTITYTPNANYNGSDSFTYTVTSGGVTETATITINLTPVNDAVVPTLTITPVARWTFDESSGTTTKDAYNAQTGTLSDSVPTPTTVLPTWTTGHNGTSGTALHFDGTGSYVALSSTTTAPLMGTSSLTFWIKTTQTGNVDGWDSPAVIASEQAGGTNDIQWGVLNGSGKIGFDVGNATGVYSTTSVNDNTWHQVAITRDASTGLVNVYVDGALEATGSPTDAGFTATLNRLAGFGATNNFSNDASGTDATDYRFLNADLDDVRIYNHVLTADQVAAIKSVESGYENTAVANDGDAIKLSVAATDYTALSVHGLNTGMVISDGAGHTTTIGASGTDTVVDLTGWNLTALSVTGAGTGSATLVFDAVDTVAGESHATTQYVNIVNGTSLLSGGTGNDTLTGTSGADLIVGNAGNDTLNGGAGNDRILGGDGNDTINGGAGNDIIYGGAGNDVMTGGTGADTFAWHLADRGTAGAPAADTITDFNVAAVASGGDTLDLRDLLVGANHVGTDPGNLSKYLDFDTTSTPGSTVIHVSSTGGYAGGTYSAASTDETITLQGVDLRTALGLGTAATDNQIITELLTRNKLVTDGH